MLESLTEPQFLAVIAVMVATVAGAGYGMCWLFQVRPLLDVAESDAAGFFWVDRQHRLTILRLTQERDDALAKLAPLERRRGRGGKFVKQADQSAPSTIPRAA